MPRISIVFLLLIALSCQTKPKQETSATTPAIDSAATLAKRPGPDAPRSATDRLVRALYFEHDSKNNPFLETTDPALAEQFFTKSTAAVILRNAKRANDNRKKINPLFNVPESAIEKRWVLPATVLGQRATVFVTYYTDGKLQEIRCEMNQLSNGRWRINDIVYADGKRLTDPSA